jgi:hypothetical protein
MILSSALFLLVTNVSPYGILICYRFSGKKNTAMFTVETLLCFVAKLTGLDSNHYVLFSSNLARQRLFEVSAVQQYFLC